MTSCSLVAFGIIGSVFGSFYAWKFSELGWNGDYGYKHFLERIINFKLEDRTPSKPERVPLFIDRRKIFNTEPPPLSWWIEMRVQNFLGAFLGWIIFWFLIDIRLNAFKNFQNSQYDWWDGIAFIIAWVGICGRLPTIAHSVQEWFKR